MKSFKRKKRILVCDDDESILEVIEIILTENNYKVITTTECEGIEKNIKEFKPDLILLDVWMKSCDGRVIAKDLVEQKENKNVPILFISALNELEKISISSNVKGLIRKPFELEELLEKVKSVLQ